MKIHQTIILAMITLLSIALIAACGSKKSATPTEAMKNFYEAVKKKDAGAVKAMLSKESRPPSNNRFSHARFSPARMMNSRGQSPC